MVHDGASLLISEDELNDALTDKVPALLQMRKSLKKCVMQR